MAGCCAPNKEGAVVFVVVGAILFVVVVIGGGFKEGEGCDAVGGVDGAVPTPPNENPPPAAGAAVAAGVVDAAADVPLPKRAVVLFPQVTMMLFQCMMNIVD